MKYRRLWVWWLIRTFRKIWTQQEVDQEVTQWSDAHAHPAACRCSICRLSLCLWQKSTNWSVTPPCPPLFMCLCHVLKKTAAVSYSCCFYDPTVVSCRWSCLSLFITRDAFVFSNDYYFYLFDTVKLDVLSEPVSCSKVNRVQFVVYTWFLSLKRAD